MLDSKKCILLPLVVLFFVACSPVKFSLDTSKCGSTGQSCLAEDGKLHYDNIVPIGGGKVDILIVDDNSASMSSLQRSLSSRFAGFIDQLDAQGVDYRIGLTTTDISSNVSDTANNYPRAVNSNGALQDGNLVAFGSYPYLTPGIADRKNLFNSTIVRQETVLCEQFIANWIQQYGLASIDSSSYSSQYVVNCPSGDNRDIFAANLTLQKNPSSFIRSDAALAIILLGDSDERDGMYVYSGLNFKLSDMDQPATLINNFWSKYGKQKSLSVHAITVIDDACLNQRANQTLGTPAVAATAGLTHGSMGQAFLALTNQGWGRAVDICFNNYTAQLGSIGTSILSQASQLPLACNNPTGLSITGTSVPWTQTGGQILFSSPLPPGTSVHLVYDCPGVQ